MTKQTPKSIEALQPIKGLSERTLARNREAIWQAIERGLAGELPPIHQKNQHQACDEGYEARVDLALPLLKACVCLPSWIQPLSAIEPTSPLWWLRRVQSLKHATAPYYKAGDMIFAANTYWRCYLDRGVSGSTQKPVFLSIELRVPVRIKVDSFL